METVVEEAGPTRPPRRDRTKSSKALELERTTHCGKSAGRHPAGTSSQRVRDGRDQDESNESETEDAIYVATTVPNAPQRNRTATNPRLQDQRASTRLNQVAAEKGNVAVNLQIKVLTDLITSLLREVKEQKQLQANQTEILSQRIDALRAENKEMRAENKEMRAENEEMRAENKEMRETIQAQLANVQAPPSATPSYADIARTPPTSQPSNLPSLSLNTTPSTMTDTLYCTVDTSRVQEEDQGKAQPGTIRQAIEKEMRTTEGREGWRCAAVIRDPRNTTRIRITCRDESELQRVKEAAQKSVSGARVLRDQLYPVKVDNANRTAVLDENGVIRPGVMDALGKENEVHIAKMAWLSKKDAGKAYGSMVVYMTKGSDASRLLQGQYFHVAGESAYTRIYEPRYGPVQCYQCQELGHKAHACTKTQVCGKCAQEGHHHRDCRAEIPKCVLCAGPHEAFSKNCRVLHPNRHA